MCKDAEQCDYGENGECALPVKGDGCFRQAKAPETPPSSGQTESALLARELCRVDVLAYERGYLGAGGIAECTEEELQEIIEAEWEGWLDAAKAIIKQAG